MAYQLRWLVPNRIITLYMYDELKAEEFRQMTLTTLEMMEQGTAPIHTLSIVAPDAVYPKSPQAILSMIKSVNYIHPNTGWVMQISQNPVQRFVASMIAQGMGNVRFATAHTVADALIFLKDRDVTLSDIDTAALAAVYERMKPAALSDQSAQ
ncbi:MAG: hypothetical protein SF162_12030 [bacterium]|nr:hypothetical protein [bacterium]